MRAIIELLRSVLSRFMISPIRRLLSYGLNTVITRSRRHPTISITQNSAQGLAQEGANNPYLIHGLTVLFQEDSPTSTRESGVFRTFRSVICALVSTPPSRPKVIMPRWVRKRCVRVVL